eukprot:1462211-Alexandrium_andersonii.AAC.1
MFSGIGVARRRLSRCEKPRVQRRICTAVRLRTNARARRSSATKQGVERGTTGEDRDLALEGFDVAQEASAFLPGER